jgi:aquaglyceroporin related protein, other eukaryote
MAEEKEDLTAPVTHADHVSGLRRQPSRRTSVFGQPAFAEHGALINHQIPQADVVQAEPDLLWSRIRQFMREPFSEFFGVFILILFGDGVVAQVVLSKGTKGDYQSISWGWG